MNAQSLPLDAGHDELQRVVARIGTRKASQAPLAPAPAVLAAIVAHLRGEEPFITETVAGLSILPRATQIGRSGRRCDQPSPCYRLTRLML